MRLVPLSLVLFAGCATAGASRPQYLYRPAVGGQATAEVNGTPAARYPIPADRPAGELRVASSGVVELGNDGGATRVLHVRLVAFNGGDDTPWTIDTRTQLVSIVGEGGSRPAFASSDAGGAPIVQVAKGQQRTIDLYYPLPPALASADRLPAFNVSWQVVTGRGAVAESTAFDRTEAGEAYASSGAYPYPYGALDGYPYGPYGYGYAYGYGGYPYWPYGAFAPGFGPYWWYDPWYSSYAFPHVRGIVVRPGYRPDRTIHVVPSHVVPPRAAPSPSAAGVYGRRPPGGAHWGGGRSFGGHRR